MPPPPATHHVITGADGAPLLVKRATGPEGRDRLRDEARWLRQVDLPGVVDVVDLVDGDGATELHLAWVGPHTVATVTCVPAPDAGRLVARVADVVAALHSQGIVHRRLVSDHVLLGADGEPVLTGFAEAVGGRGGDPRDDVAALGALVTVLVAPDDDALIVPERRRGRSRDAGLRGALLTVADLVATLDPADRPTAEDLAGRLRELVDAPVTGPRAWRWSRRAEPVSAPVSSDSRRPSAVDAPDPSLPRIGYGPQVTQGPARPSTSTAPGAPVPPPEGRRRRSPRRLLPAPAPRARPRRRILGVRAERGLAPLAGARRRRLVGLAVAGLAVAATVVVVATLSPVSSDTESASPALPPPTVASGPAPTTRDPSPTPSTSHPPIGSTDDPVSPRPGPVPGSSGTTGCPSVPASPAADIDGDGCPDALRIDQERVTSGDTTWVVGRPGDVIAVADWDCDGRATVASLRPSTGEVFVFDRWVSGGSELTVVAATIVPGARDLRAVDDDGDGCARLAASRADGGSVDVRVGEAG